MKYIKKESYEIYDDMPQDNNYFEVDEEIANTIMILNKKGYQTSNCCAGHSQAPIIEIQISKEDIPLYDKTEAYSIEFKDNKYYAKGPLLGSTIYIGFKANYQFKSIPTDFVYRDQQLSYYFLYYKKNEMVDQDKLCSDITKHNNILLKWAEELPNN